MSAVFYPANCDHFHYVNVGYRDYPCDVARCHGESPLRIQRYFLGPAGSPTLQ